MNWIEILGLILGSSVVTAIVTAFADRRIVSANARKVNAEVDDSYADRLERRIYKLEKRQERYELRDAIHQSALNCAHKCTIPDEDCPVLIYLENHPVKSIVDDEEV